MNRRGWLSAAMTGAFLIAGCGAAGDGLEKHKVWGRVKINGKPTPMVVVNFQNVRTDVPGRNARYPVGVTDEFGNFHLSTNGNGDGALAGEYVVTFEWLSANDASAKDLLEGRYSNPKTSKYQVRVEPGPNNLEPFELEVEDSKVSRASERPLPNSAPAPALAR